MAIMEPYTTFEQNTQSKEISLDKVGLLLGSPFKRLYNGFKKLFKMFIRYCNVLPTIPDNWDYGESVNKVKSFIYKWKGLTNEMITELWVAREKLSSRYYHDGTIVPSWSQYCKEIGSSKRVVNRWLSTWFKKYEREAIFTSRWALVEGYWNLGKRIREDENLKTWHAKGNYTYLQGLANNIATSERTLYYAIQFYNKYPSLDKVPEGKNITMDETADIRRQYS